MVLIKKVLLTKSVIILVKTYVKLRDSFVDASPFEVSSHLFVFLTIFCLQFFVKQLDYLCSCSVTTCYHAMMLTFDCLSSMKHLVY